jgi:hypothetical protein
MDGGSGIDTLRLLSGASLDLNAISNAGGATFDSAVQTTYLGQTYNVYNHNSSLVQLLIDTRITTINVL